MDKKILVKILKLVVSVIILGITFFPLFYMVSTGFKGRIEIAVREFHLLPQHWFFENYQKLLGDELFIRSIWTTFLGALVFAVVGAIISSMAGYAFARLEFKFKKILWPLVLITMFIPWMSILVTSFMVVSDLHMLDTIWVLIIPGLASASDVFFFRQFYLSFPIALEEAALVDGANRFYIYWKIFIPNSLSIFVIIGIMRFMGYWNSYVWAVMTISNKHLYTIMQSLSYFKSAYGTDWGMIMAGASIAAIPPLVLLIIFQKHIVQGVKISGIK